MGGKEHPVGVWWWLEEVALFSESSWSGCSSSLTLLLFLLFLLVYLVLHNTAELGLAGALSLADGLQQRDLATGRVHHFLGSSLDWEERLLRQG